MASGGDDRPTGCGSASKHKENDKKLERKVGRGLSNKYLYIYMYLFIYIKNV